MEYVIGAIAGAVIFAAGFFVALKTMCVSDDDTEVNKSEEHMDEGLKDYIKQYNNFMNYNGRPMR